MLGATITCQRQSREALSQLHLSEFIHRAAKPEPWVEGDRIPWGDAKFSKRMLREHLSQEHNAASRKSEIIDSHVEAIHRRVLNSQPSKILDLGCGPGLYAVRLARLGHCVTGIDISPAALRYARDLATGEKLDCQFIEGDLREADYGQSFDLVMQVFGEMNTFAPRDVARILEKSRAALRKGGRILLEIDLPDFIRSIGEKTGSWKTVESGLFLDRPHVFLTESSWDEAAQAATTRFVTIDAASSEVTMHTATQKAYSEAEFTELMIAAGFGDIHFQPSISDATEHGDPHRGVLTGVKQG